MEAQPHQAVPRSEIAELSQLLGYWTKPRADDYVNVVQVFVDRAERFDTTSGLTAAELSAELAGRGIAHDPDACETLCVELTRWGNLNYRTDFSTARTLAEARRKSFRYSLTDQTKNAHHAMRLLRHSLGERGALQAVVIGGIATDLERLADDVASGRADPGNIYRTVQAITSTFDHARHRAEMFFSHLAEAADTVELDFDTYEQFQTETVQYVTQFLGDLEPAAQRITSNLARLHDANLDHLLTQASQQENNPADPDAPARWHDEQARKLAGLTAWFDRRRPDAAINDLATAARAAINTTLAQAQRLSERSRRVRSRQHDLREVARWFADADQSDADALATAVYAAPPALHHDTVAPEVSDRAARAEWFTTPDNVVDVAVELRARGTGQARVRQPRTIKKNRRAQTRVAAQRVEQRKLEQAARQRVVDATPSPLSDLPSFDRESSRFLRQLIRLLAAAPAEADGSRAVTTADGQYQVVARPIGDGRKVAAIGSGDGTLYRSDLLFNVLDLRGGPRLADTDLDALTLATEQAHEQAHHE